MIVAPALDGAISAEAVAAGVGGILLLGTGTPADLQQKVALAQRAASTPLLVMADEEGGGVQRLSGLVKSMPWPRTMTATLTPGQVQAATAVVGVQMLHLGVNVDLAPVLDLDDRPGPNDQNPDGQRSFSASPSIAARYSDAFITGLQGAGVLAVAKHFPGLGGATGNTDLAPAATNPIAALRTAALVPFRAAIASGVRGVMIANATVPGLTILPASLSPEVITGLLRTDLGFTGLVVTDSLSARAISAAGYDLNTAAIAALKAGSDMVLFGSTLTAANIQALTPPAVERSVSSLFQAIVAAVQDDTLPLNRLNDAVLAVLSAKGTHQC